MKLLNSKLRTLYHSRPRWVMSLYNRLPVYVQGVIRQKIGALVPAREIQKQEKTVLFPLDSAWAEVIFAPFHDSLIAPGLPIDFQPINGYGCKIDFFWCWTVLSWEGCKAGKDAVSMNLKTDVETHNYNKLILCLTLPKESSARVTIRQNNTWITIKKKYPGTGKRMEIVLPIDDGILNDIRLHFIPDTKRHQRIELSWFGLQNSQLTQRMRSHRLTYSTDWPGLIKPVSNWESVKFEIGLLFDQSELTNLRLKKKLPGWDIHFQLLEKKAEKYLQRHPENDLADYLPFNDSRYLRTTELDQTPYYFEALILGFVGLVNRNQKMILHALRYLMCMLHTEHWTQSAESRLVGSTWDQRCFLEEMTVSSVTILADWFSFALTDQAKSLVRQSIWDKGLSIIERDLMKYEYLYRINQGAVFCRARILGGLYLEAGWPRVGKYVDRSFSDMISCLRNYIEKDGGTHEGVGYFCQTLQATLPATIAYARNRKLSLKKIIAKNFRQCEKYVAAMSGSIPGTAMVEGDCRTDYFNGDAIPILANFFPGGACEKILGACLETGNVFAVTGTLTDSGGITGFVYGPEKIEPPECVAPTFSIMGKSGHLASFRRQDAHSARLHLIGSKPFPSHSHFDKGAIILEVDTVPVLIDRGMVNYYYSEATELKRSAMHNIITPVLGDGTYPDQEHPVTPIIPTGRGNKKSLETSIDLSRVWNTYMLNCTRSVSSPAINEYMIVDECELRIKGAIAFHLHSTFPFKITDKKIILKKNDSILLTIETIWADSLTSHQESINLKHEPIFHLIIKSPFSKRFKLKTRISWNL